MNFRKNSTLIIGCSIALVLLLAALFFLIKNQGVYRKNTEELERARNRLSQLNNRDPYPSAANVTVSQENLDILKQKYQDVWTELAGKQLDVQVVEPARFAPLLEDAGRRIYAEAADSGVTVSPDLNLGFKDYAEGKLPPDKPEVMKRLVLQLNAIEDIALRLIDCKVQSIDGIGRDMFEKEVKDEDESDNLRGRGRNVSRARQAPAKETLVFGLPKTAANDLYTTERFSFEFVGWESSIWEVLNNLAGADKIYRLVDISFENTNKDVGKPVDLKNLLGDLTSLKRERGGIATGMAVSSDAIPEMALRDIPHEDRIAGGLEPIRAKLIIDMYHFTDDADVEGEQ